ncbi:MAG: hypothetical protein E6J90_46285 [Deltaproteobacteria bacterium]|nr:MAG: hypothetical protein E6J91_42545 [Deltaproteobacteria bacterium]TMQ06450.1 MAG: hypothetical protein E6J90_46285 [Deltaproteobacteria bacterium]
MVRGNHQQLAFALGGRDLALAPTARVATRTCDARTPNHRSTARATVTGKVTRTRSMPSRDSRGRFVSFPTIDAPGWYVFCADGYRIPGEPPTDTIAPQPLPRAVARSRRIPRTRLTRADLLTYLVFVVGYIAVLWYGLHLPRPNR